jgi:hypothetical protein
MEIVNPVTPLSLPGPGVPFWIVALLPMVSDEYPGRNRRQAYFFHKGRQDIDLDDGDEEVFISLNRWCRTGSIGHQINDRRSGDGRESHQERFHPEVSS